MKYIHNINLRFQLVRFYYQVKYILDEIKEWFQKNCPIKIPIPKPAVRMCDSITWDDDDNEKVCGQPMHIVATDTGDGWLFFWECDAHECCDAEEYFIEGWYPFRFGVWCNEKDLARIGIEVV